MNSTTPDTQKIKAKKSWRWWQNNAATTNSTTLDKSPDVVVRAEELRDEDEDQIDSNKLNCSSSIAQSSLVVHHSIHSKESEDIASTTSIKSKPWVSKKLRPPTATGQDDDEDDQNTLGTTQSINKIESNSTKIKENYKTASSSSLMNATPSISSSTVPVYNFNPEPEQPRRSSGIKAKFGRWVNRSNGNKD
ncbi:40S ribosomal protein S25 [Mucor velutinosus]|uniref:40S ribosomal protein S25 n=1 Tax=Mucor velutinosus TaxID=708070 RepID=A0AAN7DC48_9FUNG|nr:40S ribosomal protein S25 [Mucor velutinosus]